jgi:hypothetical protein
MLEQQQRVSEAVDATTRASAKAAPQLAMLPLQGATAASREMASGVQEVQRALADSVVEGMRVNTEACLDALRCATLPELSTLQGRLIAQWARLNMETGSRVLRATQRAFLGSFSAEAFQQSSRRQ